MTMRRTRHKLEPLEPQCDQGMQSKDNDLLVVKFPQAVVPQNWARKDFAHEVHIFG